MAGPWEAYQSTAPASAPKPAGPWQNYAGPGYSPDDVDAIVRTTAFEETDPKAQQGVASVIANRAASLGRSPAEVVRSPKEGFEPWSAHRPEVEALTPDSPKYRDTLHNIEPVLSNGPVTDATHFYAPKAQAALGRPPPKWDDGSGLDVGQTRFFTRPEEYPPPAAAPTPAPQSGHDPGVFNPEDHNAWSDAQAKTLRGIQPDITFKDGKPTYKGYPILASKDGTAPTEPGTWYVMPAGDLKQVPVEVDEWLGFQKGVFKPLDNAALAADTLLRRAGLDTDAISHAMGAPSTREAIDSRTAYLAGEKAKGVLPGKAAEFAGNVVGTTPLVLTRAGPILEGAASGALLTDNKDAKGIARDAVYGAVGGKLAHGAVGAASKAVSGVTDEAVQALRKAGVTLTPGQLVGGAGRRVEDALAGFPVVGDVIKAGQRRSIESLNAAAINRTLAPIGEALPKGMKVGREAVDYAYDRLGQKYDELLPDLNIQADGEYASGMYGLRSLAQSLPPDQAGAFDNIVKTEVARRFAPNGTMTGEAMKDAESALGQHIRAIRRNPNSSKWDQDLGDALQETQDQLRQLVMRSNPTRAGELQAINEGYANYKRVETAAGAAGATNGIFTPANLAQAVRQNATKGSYARGHALMEDLSDPAKAVLPPTIPDSGTAGRSAVGLAAGALAAGKFVPPAAPALAAGAALLSLYSKTGSKMADKVLAARPAGAAKAAEMIARGRALAALAGAAGAVDSRK